MSATSAASSESRGSARARGARRGRTAPRSRRRAAALTVTFSPTGHSYAGSLTVSSPTGSVVVPVTATVTSAVTKEHTPSPVSPARPRPAAARPTTAASVSEEATAPPEGHPRLRLRVITGLTAIAGGLLILASITVPWRYGQTYADSDPSLVLAMAIPGLMAVAAGVTMFAPRVRTEVALGLLLAVSATAGASLLNFMGLLAGQSSDAIHTGGGWPSLG